MTKAAWLAKAIELRDYYAENGNNPLSTSEIKALKKHSDVVMAGKHGISDELRSKQALKTIKELIEMVESGTKDKKFTAS